MGRSSHNRQLLLELKSPPFELTPENKTRNKKAPSVRK
jgi:hypothetical protein